MTRHSQRKLPSRLGFCKYCRKDTYPDRIGANLALEFLSKNPPRGAIEPRRTYPCPVNAEHYHLTSEEKRDFHESA